MFEFLLRCLVFVKLLLFATAQTAEQRKHLEAIESFFAKADGTLKTWHEKPEPRSKPVMRWRATGGRYEINQDHFTLFGDVYVRNDYFFNRDDTYSQDSLKGLYLCETNWLSNIAATLGQLGRVVSEKMNNQFSRTSWTARGGGASIFDTYIGGYFSCMAFRYSTVQELLRSGMKQTDFRNALQYFNMAFSEVYGVLNYIVNAEIRARDKEEPAKPHPMYLDYVDVSARQAAFFHITSFADSARYWGGDMSVSSLTTWLNAIRDLSKRGNRLYDKMLARYGYHFTKTYSYWEDRGTKQRPSKAQVKKADKTARELRALSKKMETFGDTRLDGFPANLKFTFGAQPQVVITLHADVRNVYQVTIGDIQKKPSQRIGDLTVAKFAGYKDFLRARFAEFFGPFLYRYKDNPTRQSLLRHPQGANFTVYLRTELICYWQRDRMRPRMMEILYVAIPGVTGDILDTTKLADDPWLIAGITFDTQESDDRSFIFDEEEEKEAPPTRDAVNLLRSYIKDEAEQKGVMQRVRGQLIDVSERGMCDITEGYKNVHTYMSQAPRAKTRDDVPKVTPPAEVCTRFPAWFKPTLKSAMAFPSCLNLFPVGTQMLFKGENVPGSAISKTKIAPEVSALKKASMDVKLAPKSAKNARPDYMFEDDIYLQIQSAQSATGAGGDYLSIPSAERQTPIVPMPKAPPVPVVTVTVGSICHSDLIADETKNLYHFTGTLVVRNEDFKNCQATTLEPVPEITAPLAEHVKPIHEAGKPRGVDQLPGLDHFVPGIMQHDPLLGS